MAKRPHNHDGLQHEGPPHKRSQKSHGTHDHLSHSSPSARHTHFATPVDYAGALKTLPPPIYAAPYTFPAASAPSLVFSDGLPTLPPVSQALASAPFTHKSMTSYSRTGGGSDSSYERLEFLGDAYLELFASHLIFARYSHLPAGQMSQLRELLIKNETLSEFALLYGFDKRVSLPAMEQMISDAKSKGNKGFNKVLGDMFEAYVAAIVMSNIDGLGMAMAEQWVTALWSVKLLEQQQRDRTLLPPVAALPDGASTVGGGVHSPSASADLRTTYNPDAKSLLQRRIKGGRDTILQYEQDGEVEELKGAQLGQSRHKVALYLTGYGHERRLLGKGEGKSKAEAGAWAAMEAMYGENQALVNECEAAMQAFRVKKAAERAQEERENGTSRNPDETAAGQDMTRDARETPKKKAGSRAHRQT